MEDDVLNEGIFDVIYFSGREKFLSDGQGPGNLFVGQKGTITHL